MNQLLEPKASRLRLSLALTALLFGLSAICSNALAQEKPAADPAKDEKKPDVEMLECKVKVVDPDGFPVEDATVFCAGMRSKEERGSHWGWSEESFGKAPRVKTNADGIAMMPYPKMLAEGQTTAEMTWSVEHPAFVNYRRDHSVDDDPAELTLESGFRIALMATNAATGDRVKEKLHAVTSFEGGGEWELKKNGMFVSGMLKKQKGIMRVACFQDGKPTLFSKEIKIDPAGKSRVLLKDIELSLGCRIEGKLDQSVERPVRNGYVIATLVKRPDSKGWNSLWWSDETKISEDGAFVFDSLPGDEAIQMIPICDGYVPAKPKLEDVLAVMPTNNPDQRKNSIAAFSATPQLVKSVGDTVTTELSMNKAATVTVKVVDQDGEPIENLRVATSPNQFWFDGGSQILSDSYPTRKLWELKQAGKDLTSYFRSKGHSYMKKTDKNGMVQLKNMPKGSHGFGVHEQEWEMKVDPVSGDRETRVKVGDKDLNITIKLYPKGSLPRNNQQPLPEVIAAWWNRIMEMKN